MWRLASKAAVLGAVLRLLWPALLKMAKAAAAERDGTSSNQHGSEVPDATTPRNPENDTASTDAQPGQTGAPSLSKKTKGANKAKLRFAPFWLLLAIAGLACGGLGYYLLPPSEASVGYPTTGVPTLSVQFSQPDIITEVVLDASNLGIPELLIFTNSFQGNLGWRVTSSDNDLHTFPFTFGTMPLTEAEGIQKNPAGYFTELNSETNHTIGSIQQLASQGADTADIEVDLSGLFAQAGSKERIAFPMINLTSGGSVSDNSPSGHWYAPAQDSSIFISGPSETRLDQTDVVTPAFWSTGSWYSTNGILEAYWTGTDLEEQDKEQSDLFLAGLLLGLAGPALIAAAQELRSKRREQREGST